MRQLSNSEKNITYLRQRQTDGAFRPLSESKGEGFFGGFDKLTAGRVTAGAVGSKPRGFFSAFVSGLIVVSMLGVNFSNTGYTISYFSDKEVSRGNYFWASLLDFFATPDELFETYVGLEDGGEVTLVTFISPAVGSNMQYKVFAEEVSGQPVFCSAIHAVSTTSPFVYSGDLKNLVAGPTENTDEWTLELSLTNSAGIAHDDVCYMDLVYQAWKTGVPEGTGYTDEERVHLKLNARMVVLNEFLPHPIGADNAPMPGGEWVELYNISGVPVDVAGWVLYGSLDSRPLVISLANSDNNGNFADSGETTIPAGGYLVVYLNGAYTGWLNNTGEDSVRLYNGPIGSGVLIDAYSYSGSVPENKSYARIPNGTGAWVDPIPTPGFANILDLEVESFHVLEEVSVTSLELGVVSDDPLGADQATSTGTILDEDENKNQQIIGGGGGGSLTLPPHEIKSDEATQLESMVVNDEFPLMEDITEEVLAEEENEETVIDETVVVEETGGNIENGEEEILEEVKEEEIKFEEEPETQPELEPEPETPPESAPEPEQEAPEPEPEPLPLPPEPEVVVVPEPEPVLAEE